MYLIVPQIYEIIMTIENPTREREGKSTCLKRNKSKSTKTNNEVIDYQLVIKRGGPRHLLVGGNYLYLLVAVEPAVVGIGGLTVAG